jgi:Sjoegren syndrome nuclear autoantigen 1
LFPGKVLLVLNDTVPVLQEQCMKMAAHGAALQNQNNELVKCIEDLKEKREMLARSIREDEAEKSKIQQDLQVGPGKGDARRLRQMQQNMCPIQLLKIMLVSCLNGRKIVQTLTRRLTQINDALSKKHQARSDYDKIVQETETAYSKIVESSHTLLNVLKKEATSISRRSASPQHSVA